MSTMFKPATRKQKKLRLLLAGPTNAGKSRTALRFAFGIVAHELKLAGIDRPPKIWAMDSEHGRLSFYHGLADDGVPYIFDVCEMAHHDPTAIVAVMKEAFANRVDAFVVDSLSQSWASTGGALEQVNTESNRDKGNKFAGWGVVTPKLNSLTEVLLSAPCHIIATVRQKMEWVLEPDPNKPGKNRVRSVGLQDVQRDTLRYEFDVVADIGEDHVLEITKSPWDQMDRGPIEKAGAAFIVPLVDWLREAGPNGEDRPQIQPTATKAAVAAVSATGEPVTSAQLMEEAFAELGKKITKSQRSEIIFLCEQIFGKGEPTKAAIKKANLKRGVEHLDDLSAVQAAAMIENLRRIYTDREVSAGGPPSPSPSQSASGVEQPTAAAPSNA